MTMVQGVWNDIAAIRARAPLVHNITNYVVMNLTANALLALGASPVMAHAAEEVEDMVGIADALVLNIGTLSRPWIEAMEKAAGAAGRKGIPVVVDPVGAGATPFRTATALRLIAAARPAVLRGNASEIRALALSKAETKGVDSRHGAEEAVEAARTIARRTGGAVSVSGPVDIVVDGSGIVRAANGHPLMPRVTGLGCVASALTGAFAAVNPSPLRAAAHAMAVMGIAGELAGAEAAGPASFQVRFLDALYAITEEDITRLLKIETA
ncbi:MAG: hydroxyethylthiazole kinase [Candidatus Aminicenantes bacterium]|nr:hydroxyethylthiazole kinase [Candidatus Aminicenantes bacterium]